VLFVSSVFSEAAAAPAAAPTTAGGTTDVTVFVVVCVWVLVLVVVTTAVEVTGGDVTVSLTVVAVDAGGVVDVWAGLVGAVAVVVGSVETVVVGVGRVGSVRVPVPVKVDSAGRSPPPPQAESKETEKNPRVAAEPSRQAFAACDVRMPARYESGGRVRSPSADDPVPVSPCARSSVAIRRFTRAICR
jgi:hypothetical protein